MREMLHLYVVRHGQTEWNVEKRLQGRKNSNLTETGIHDAKLLGKKLAATDFEAVYASPSARAVETTKLIIGERNLPLITDERLMEIDLGEWEGRTVDEITQNDGESYDVYQHQPQLFQGTGESFHDVRKRIVEVLKELEETYSTGNLLIVTHGVVIKVLQTIMKGLPIDHVWDPPYIDGTSLTVVKMDDGKKEILLEGDVSHKVNSVAER